MAFDLVGKAVRFLRLPTVDYLNAPTKIISAQQNDVNSRYFQVKLYDDRGDINFTGYRAVLTAAPPDSEDILYTDGEVSEDGAYAVCVLSGDMLKNVGKVKCEVSFLKGDSSGQGNGVQITSQTFYVVVSSSISNDEAVEGSSGYGLLLDVLEELAETEEARNKAEEARVKAETARVEAEAGRVAAENSRIEAEQGRVTAESNRASAESNRAEAESSRIAAEKNRAAAEELRSEAEEQREANENERIQNENERKVAEEGRIEAEAQRVQAENNRVTAENTRVEAEEERVSAENGRVDEFASIKEDCENATAAANTAKTKVDEVLAALDALPSAIDYTLGEQTVSVVSLHFIEEEQDEV